MSFLARLFGKPSVSSDLAALVDTFVAAPSWEASQELVEQHPELLSQPALDELLKLADLAGRRHDTAAQALFEEHLAVLLRCQEAGIERAFMEKTGAGTRPTLRLYLSSEAALETDAAHALSPQPAQAEERTRPATTPPAPIEEVTAEVPLPKTPDALPQAFTAASLPPETPDSAPTAPHAAPTVRLDRRNVAAEIPARPELAATEPVAADAASKREPRTAAAPPDPVESSVPDLAEAVALKRLQDLRAELNLLNLNEDPQRWAAARQELAAALLQHAREKPDPERSRQEVEEALVCYYEALEAYHPRRQAEQWGGVHLALGETFLERQVSSRLDNLEQARHHFEEALKVYPVSRYPAEWAAVQVGLGAVLAQQASLAGKGKHARILEEALAHYVQALEVFTRHDYPAQWADLQERLAAASLDQAAHGEGNYVQRAIQFYYLALQVYDQRKTPERWANVNAHLAELLCERSAGDVPAEVVEQAIQHALNALQVYTRQTHPERWADTHRCLAAAFQKRQQGEPRDNLERAMHHVQCAMEVYTQASSPERWARLQEILDRLAT